MLQKSIDVLLAEQKALYFAIRPERNTFDFHMTFEAAFRAGVSAQPVVREPLPLTDEEIALAIFEARVGHSPIKRDGSTSFRIARAAIAKFCEVNGITPGSAHG